MNHKYETGQYIVRIFDKYGTAQQDLKAPNYIGAVQLGVGETAGGGSFVVLRVLHNSLDGHPTTVGNDEEESE